MDQIMTLEEVAAYLRVSDKTVKEWVNKGELPGGKLGTSWRFRREDIEQWLEHKLTPHDHQVVTPSAVVPQVFIQQDRIVISEAKDRDSALNELIDLWEQIPGVDSRAILSNAIFSREKLMTTGLGLSIAVPHARISGVDGVYASISVVNEGIEDYQSIDGSLVKIIIMIVSGRDLQAEYLKTLSYMVETLQDETLRATICSAKSSEEIYNVFVSK